MFRYEPDTGSIYWTALGKGKIKKKPAGTVTHAGYVGILIDGKRYHAHRIAWALHNGAWPDDQIDHINGNKLDNRIDNLRPATNSQNGKNLKLSIANTSGHTGVTWCKTLEKWRAVIKVDGKQINCGRYACKNDAINARKSVEIKYFGEWSRQCR
jgi:hypothetical protein